MSDINVQSSTQKIFVDPASSSVSVINTGPPGPATGLPGAPGTVQAVMAGDYIEVDSNAPAYPIVSALPQVLSGPYRSVSLGGLPAGPYTWPQPPRDVGDYCGANSFYATVGGAVYDGIYGVSALFTANESDAGLMSMMTTFNGVQKVTSACFAYASYAGYFEHYLAAGQHVLWQIYKSSGVASFTACSLAFAMTYRPMTE
jgi:hypothetical protein